MEHYSFSRINGRSRHCEVTRIHTTLIVLLCIAFLGDIGMLAFAFKRTGKAGSVCFAMLVAALLFDTLGYTLELLSTTPGELMIALRLENLGIPLLSPFFMLTILDFFYPNAPLRKMIIASVIYGGCMGLLIFFNDQHMLYYTSVEMVHNGFFYVAKLPKGPLYYVQQAVTLLCMLGAYTLMLLRFMRGSAKLRRQMVLLIYGSFFPFAANIVNLLNIAPLGLDLTPLALSVGLIFFAVNLSKYKLMDITPAAFDMAIEKLDDAVIVLDNDWCFIYCNPKAASLFPSLGAFTGTEEVIRVPNWPEPLHPNADEQTTFSIRDSVSGEITLQHAKIAPILNKRNRKIGIVINIKDITETTNMLHQLEKMAITDPLTGAFNRRHFMTQVGRQMDMSLRHGLPTGILLLDIDHFKVINDTYGHFAGDHVLRRLVQIVSKQLRTHDMLARYGGEEFIILSVEKDETALKAFAERLRRTIEKERIVHAGVSIPITASFGAVIIPPGQTYEIAMLAVDKALYTAKNSGRNRVVIGKIDVCPLESENQP